MVSKEKKQNALNLELIQKDRDRAHEARWLKNKRSSNEQSIMDASKK
ncbi:MAG: hypothetical protein WC462_03165 [archaeon]